MPRALGQKKLIFCLASPRPKSNAKCGNYFLFFKFDLIKKINAENYRPIFQILRFGIIVRYV